MKKSWYKIFNYGSIALVFVLAIILGIDMFRGTFDLIPRVYYIPILIVVGIVFILRIAIRLYLTKITKQ